MKTRSITIAILGALVLAAVAYAQQTLPPPRPGFSFPIKQTLTYEVDWRVFPAGVAVVRFEADGPRENLTASADTSGAINLIYHLSDTQAETEPSNRLVTFGAPIAGVALLSGDEEKGSGFFSSDLAAEKET